MPVTVRTPLGPLLGEESGGVRVFRGVPFAQPPIGPLRFRAPAACKPWTQPLDATHFAAAAMQSGEPGTPKSEDCLYLNVWAPAAKGPHPVYVWVHGGGFTGGHSFEPMFDGTMLAQEGIVCVTIAYRLGVFGFLDLGPLLGPEYTDSGNNGVRDLIAALEWVKQNIESLGGDPSLVTLGGQSAGAKLTDILLGVPSAQSLFHQAISESGGAERVASPEEGSAVAHGFGELWRSSTGKPVSALATAPAPSLIAVQEKFMEQWPHHYPLRPLISGSLLPRLPVETIANGMSRGRRLLIGTNLEESAYFLGPHPAHDPVAANLGNLDLARFLAVLDKYKRIYPEWTDEQRRIRALTAEEYWVPSTRVADAHIKGGGTSWFYRVDFHQGSGRFADDAYHSIELPLVWDRPSTNSSNAAAEAELARQMHGAWVAFLRGGPPAAGGLPEWPSYTASNRATMIFNSQSHVENRPNEAELRLWDGIV
jgi:para-nitrobenzyl esterase